MKLHASCFTCFALLIGCHTLAPYQLGAENEPLQIEPFSLPMWGTEGTFNPEDSPNTIFVLDFFAFWCVPCLLASQDIEANIDRYYQSSGGNSNGLPVKVVSVNIEKSVPKRTEAFIEKSGARFVVDDTQGELLKMLGGKALPFIAVIKKSESNGRFDVLYRNSGYEGASAIRSLIDRQKPSPKSIPKIATTNVIRDDAPESAEIMTPQAEPLQIATREKHEVAPARQDKTLKDSSAPQHSDRIESQPAISPQQRSDLLPSYQSAETGLQESVHRSRGYYSISTETLTTSDISLQRLDIRRNQNTKEWEWDNLLSYNRIDVDYEPFRAADIIGRPARLTESSGAFQTTASHSPSTLLEHQISGGGYYGYSDHRSLWLDEYYRQQFSGIDGYRFANPWGVNLSAGTQWDTQRPIGRIGSFITIQQDDVAPGYDRPLFQELDRGRERIHSGSLLFEQESIVSKFARMRNQLSFTRTTDRELRYQYSTYFNLALTEYWVLRAEAATTFETTESEGEPDFHSYSAGFTAEYDWDQKLFLSFSGRKYEDNGQIETSILVSAGPPPLKTTHLGAALRWQGERIALKIDLASYFTRFDEVDSPIRPFGNLYQNRDWLLANISLSRPF